MLVLQDALTQLNRVSSAVSELNHTRLTGDGVRDRAAMIDYAHGELRQELYRALLILQGMTEQTPLDENVILRR